MEKKQNEIIDQLLKCLGDNVVEFIHGELIRPGEGEGNCEAPFTGQSVYGFAIYIEDEKDKESLFNNLVEYHKNGLKIDDWKPLEFGNNHFYPLYWGRAYTTGYRIKSHLKNLKGVGSIHLQDISALKNRKIIYGTVPCKNYVKKEGEIIKKFPPLLKCW